MPLLGRKIGRLRRIVGQIEKPNQCRLKQLLAAAEPFLFVGREGLPPCGFMAVGNEPTVVAARARAEALW